MVGVNKIIIFFLLVFLALFNFALFGFFGLSGAPPDGDAIGYIAYGRNLALGNGYSIDGKTFDTAREPGYPFFLFFIFKLFGVGNLLAVKIFQTILLALTAFFVYLCFELYNRKKAGLIAAIIVAIIPTYGHYANLLYSESFFTFLLVLSFYFFLRLLKKDEKALFYVLAGAIFAATALTRFFIVLLPVILGLWLFFTRRGSLKKIVLFYFVFFLILGAWAGYVYKKTGDFTITQGRLENHLYNRSVRATLSYKDSLYYFYSWIKRSMSGGQETEVLQNYDIHMLSIKYDDLLAKGYSPNQIMAESVNTILKNPGHYFLGNIIEWVKLVWIEHLYPPVSPLLGRLVRLGFYILLYGLFLIGSVQFLKNRQRELNHFFWLAIAFLLYNWIIISFLDAFPRLNMPYLAFYLVIGIAGLASKYE